MSILQAVPSTGGGKWGMGATSEQDLFIRRSHRGRPGSVRKYFHVRIMGVKATWHRHYRGDDDLSLNTLVSKSRTCTLRISELRP